MAQSQQSVAERLAEVTGEPVEKFSARGYDIPDLDDLEWIDADEYYGDDK